MYRHSEIRGEMTKKGHQKFWRMKIKTILGKGKIGKICHGVQKFFGNRGEI